MVNCVKLCTECFYDGGELGSIHGIGAVELPVGETVNQQTKLNANDETFALAA